MSSDSNANAQVSGATGEFSASRPRDEPLTTHGHQPGQLVSEADQAPEFHAQTLPAGTAPPSQTFKPNNIAEVPAAGAAKGAETTAASDTIIGATSGDVHTGLGKPIQGQSSAEQRHDGKSHRKGEHAGLTGVTTATQGDTLSERDPEFANQRGLERDEAGGKNVLGGAPANEKVNETAHTK